MYVPDDLNVIIFAALKVMYTSVINEPKYGQNEPRTKEFLRYLNRKKLEVNAQIKFNAANINDYIQQFDHHKIVIKCVSFTDAL